ncbi:MAG TPA: DUF3617 family protein [Sphingomicrobium sp.]|nr:DUF3617 family protein [Sphingomicrobium sp.]
MNAIPRFSLAVIGLIGIGGALGAAASPSILAGVEPGLWEISRAGAATQKICIADPAQLAQFEHRGARCKREVVRESGSTAVVNYTCPDGGFGHTTMTVITPRSLRIETQGIADSAPFKYKIQARLAGNCPAH